MYLFHLKTVSDILDHPVQWTKRKTRKTEEVSSNLSSISFYFFPTICVLCFLFTLEWKKSFIKALSGAVTLNCYVR